MHEAAIKLSLADVILKVGFQYCQLQSPNSPLCLPDTAQDHLYLSLGPQGCWSLGFALIKLETTTFDFQGSYFYSFTYLVPLALFASWCIRDLQLAELGSGPAR